MAFHFVLAEMTGNPIFAAIHDATSSWLREQRAVSIALPDQMRRGAEAHRAIHAAIAARAEAAMRDHLTQVTGAYWRARAEEG